MDDIALVASRNRIVSAVQHLAAQAQHQVHYLRELGTSPSADELALDFDDALRLAPQLAAARYLTEEVLNTLSVLDRQLEQMSRGGELFSDELWSEEGLFTASAWGEVRQVAGVCLLQLKATMS